jgi:formylglycine-generating enzyme required for sulfatase activity
MFPIGLVLGGGFGALALLGIGGWSGIVLCVLLLGAAVPLVIGAEPVTRDVPGLPDGLRPSHPARQPLPENKPLPTPELTIRVVEDIPGLLEMVELPGGVFVMGSKADDEQAYDSEKPQHTVTVSSFAMGCHPVTRQLYREVMAERPGNWQDDQDDDTFPANYVSWFDAVMFCNRLSEQQGLIPCYRIDGRRVSWDREADGYQLPTEAEWEYAARAGTATRWFCGDEPTELERYAWYGANSENCLHPVGKKAPNPWGLYDMAGNVYAWCWDWYGEYDAEAVTDPAGPDSGVRRVLRGGAYWSVAGVLRSASRDWYVSGGRRVFIGFRVVRRPRRQL